MKYANALLARIGLTAKTQSEQDAFAARLARIEQREARHAVQNSVFRNQSTPQAA